MSFLNLALLGGAAAFLVPLAIHLLNRSRHQSIDWGAMHLLEAALQVNSRRLQWESILLLLLRCLIPILFAIVLARPVFTSLRSSIAQTQVSLVAVLDNSLSMKIADTNQPEKSRFELAAGEIRQLIGQQQRAEMSIWSSGGGPVNVVDGSTVDTSLALKSLAEIKTGAGPSDPIVVLDAAIAQLASMSNPNRQLVLVSDFQASQWGNLPAEKLQQIKDRIGAEQTPIQLCLLPITSSGPVGVRQNLSIELSPESRQGQLEPIFASDLIRTTATIHNWGNQLVSNLQVLFEVDGQLLAREPVDLQPNSKQQVQFACSFESTGKHLYSIRIQTPPDYVDELTEDNSSSGIFIIRESIPVLVIDPAAEASSNSVGKFIQLALSPVVGSSGFQVRLLPRLPPSEELSGFKVLALIGSSIDDNQAKHIADFVDRGGGLLLVPDDKFDWGRFNRLWYEQSRLLPARFKERQFNSQDPRKIKQRSYQQQSLSIFNSSEYGDLASVVSEQWHALEMDREPVDGLQSEALVMLDNEDLVIAKRAKNRGVVVQFGLSPDSKWSNLSTRPAFVPLIQRLVLDLVGEGVQLPQQLFTGQPLALRADQFQLLAGIGAGGTQAKTTDSWTLIDPNGDELEVGGEVYQQVEPTNATQSIALAPPIQLPVLRWPGIYRIFSKSSPEITPSPVAVAAIPSRESDLRMLGDSELEQLAKQLGAAVVRSASDYRADQQVRRDGREIWRPLLILLIVFLFAEILLARHITRGA